MIQQIGNNYPIFLELLAECTRIQGKTEESLHFYEQSLDVRTRKHANEASIDPLQEAQLQAIIWCQITLAWLNRGDLIRARQSSEHGEQVLRDANISGGSAWASLKLRQGHIYWRKGNYQEALQSANEALDLFTIALKQENHQSSSAPYLTLPRRTLAGDPVDLGRTYTLLSNLKTSEGHIIDGLQDLNKALAIFEQYDCTREIAIVSCNLGDRYLSMAEYSQAQAALRNSFRSAERMGDVPLLSCVFANLGLLDLRLGRLDEAEIECRKAIELAESINDSITISWWNSYLAPILQEQGKLSEAGTALYTALSVARSNRSALCVSLALVPLGQLRINQALNLQIHAVHIPTHLNVRKTIAQTCPEDAKICAHTHQFRSRDQNRRPSGTSPDLLITQRSDIGTRTSPTSSQRSASIQVAQTCCTCTIRARKHIRRATTV